MKKKNIIERTTFIRKNIKNDSLKVLAKHDPHRNNHRIEKKNKNIKYLQKKTRLNFILAASQTLKSLHSLL